jgi:hypothetical protein
MLTKKRGLSRVIDKNLKSIRDNPIKTGHVQREFHGIPTGRHETLAITTWRSLCCCLSVHFFAVSLCVGLVALLHFFVWLLRWQKMQMCYQMRWL